MSKSNSCETNFLSLIFNNTSWTNIGDAGGLAGSSIAGTSSVTGDLYGVAAAASTVSGSCLLSSPIITGAADISCLAVGLASVSGQATGAAVLSGESAGAGSVSADITGLWFISGGSAGIAAASGDILGAGALSGQIDGAGETNGDMLGAASVSGSAAGRAFVHQLINQIGKVALINSGLQSVSVLSADQRAEVIIRRHKSTHIPTKPRATVANSQQRAPVNG